MYCNAGGNIITDYTDCGLRNPTFSIIYAMYNTWEHNPPEADIDICNEGDGAIVTQ